MNKNSSKDPRDKPFNYNTIALRFAGFFNETTLFSNLNILLVQLETSSTIERGSDFQFIGWSQDYSEKFLGLTVFKWKR